MSIKKLSHKEEEIMQVLWRLENAFVHDILDAMEEPKPPYNTVSSTIRKLVGEGVIGYEAFGKTHRYFPLLQKEAYRRSAFSDFIQHYFSGSPEQVLSFFVQEEKVDKEALHLLLEKIKDGSSNL
jgi:BlaI family transcriptional regulator, penicillinase repressor